MPRRYSGWRRLRGAAGFLRGRRALQNLFEISQILLDHQLGVGDDFGGNLTSLATRRIPVVHLYFDAGAFRVHLLEAYLARVWTLPFSVFHPIASLGLFWVVFASNSSLAPNGPLTTQWVVSGPVGRISSTFVMN